jgi:hypothetical protein
MRKKLWASRHPWPGQGQPDVVEEILWPESFTLCIGQVHELLAEYDEIYGVFPAQAVEAIVNHPSHGSGRWFSAVNRPVTEADQSKTRKFEFVRWACIS